ncbi:unnamed protein product, partial [Prorocentrum cordatum]
PPPRAARRRFCRRDRRAGSGPLPAVGGKHGARGKAFEAFGLAAALTALTLGRGADRISTPGWPPPAWRRARDRHGSTGRVPRATHRAEARPDIPILHCTCSGVVTARGEGRCGGLPTPAAPIGKAGRTNLRMITRGERGLPAQQARTRGTLRADCRAGDGGPTGHPIFVLPGHCPPPPRLRALLLMILLPLLLHLFFLLLLLLLPLLLVPLLIILDILISCSATGCNWPSVASQRAG